MRESHGRPAREADKGNVDELNVGDSMADTVASLDAAAVSMSANPKIMSDADYDNLLHIVEAEAGTETLKVVY